MDSINEEIKEKGAFKLSDEMLKKFNEIFRRNQKKKDLSPEEIKKQDKNKKRQRQISNKSRKINQGKARKSRFNK